MDMSALRASIVVCDRDPHLTVGGQCGYGASIGGQPNRKKSQTDLDAQLCTFDLGCWRRRWGLVFLNGAAEDTGHHAGANCHADNCLCANFLAH